MSCATASPPDGVETGDARHNREPDTVQTPDDHVQRPAERNRA